MCTGYNAEILKIRKIFNEDSFFLDIRFQKIVFTKHIAKALWKILFQCAFLFLLSGHNGVHYEKQTQLGAPRFIS